MCAGGWGVYQNPKLPTVVHIVPCSEIDRHRLSPKCICDPVKELEHWRYNGEPTMHVGGVLLTHHSLEE